MPLRGSRHDLASRRLGALSATRTLRDDVGSDSQLQATPFAGPRCVRYHRSMPKFDINQYAQAGARARLTEILAEAHRIRRAFPGIETDGAEPTRGEAVARGTGAPARRGRRS